MDVNDIIKEAQEILNSYCSEICKSQCCHKGKVLVDNNFPKDLVPKNKLIKRNDGYSDLILKGGCPLLDDKLLCKIHKESYRPKACQQYPFYPNKEVIYIAKSCHAVSNDILKDIIPKFEKIGLRVIIV